jgi:hypothetical protein
LGRPVGDAVGMRTNTAYAPVRGVDREELDRQVANMYRHVANETVSDLHFPTGRPLAQGLGYPNDLLTRLPAQAVNSFAGVGYHLGLARLLQGERVLDLGGDSGMAVFAAASKWGPLRGHRGRHHTRAAPKQSACAAVSTRASYARESRNCHSTTARSTP